MKCAEHPRYSARRQPQKTTSYPDGCPTCWGAWEWAKTDPKRTLKTVNVELSPEEARVLALSLDSLMRRGDPEVVAVLQPFRLAIMRAIRDVL